MAIDYSKLTAQLKQTPTADAGNTIDYAALAAKARGNEAVANASPTADFAAMAANANARPGLPPVTETAAPADKGFLAKVADIATRFVPSVETIGAGIAAPGAAKMQQETDARTSALADAASRVIKNPDLTPEARQRVLRAMQVLSGVEGSLRGGGAFDETAMQSLGKFLTTAGTLSSGALAKGGAVALGVKGLALRAALGGAEAAGTFGVGGGLEQGGGTSSSALIAGGIGAAGPVAGKVAEFLTKKESPNIINRLIKTGNKEFSFGKNPGQGVVQEGITANSRQGLLDSIVAKKKEIGALIEKKLTLAGRTKIVKIDIAPVFVPIDKAMQKAVSDGDQALFDRLAQVKAGLTDTFGLVEGKVTSIGKKPSSLSPKDAQLLKRDIGDAVKWRDPIDGEVNKVRAKVYSLLDKNIDAAVPGVERLNQRYANMLGAEKALDRNIMNVNRLNFFRPAEFGIGGISTAAAFLSGAGNLKSLAVGIGGALALKGIRSVAIQTRLAKTLPLLDPAEQALVAAVFPKIKTAILKAVTGGGFSPENAASQIKDSLDSLPIDS